MAAWNLSCWRRGLFKKMEESPRCLKNNVIDGDILLLSRYMIYMYIYILVYVWGCLVCDHDGSAETTSIHVPKALEKFVTLDATMYPEVEGNNRNMEQIDFAGRFNTGCTHRSWILYLSSSTRADWILTDLVSIHMLWNAFKNMSRAARAFLFSLGRVLLGFEVISQTLILLRRSCQEFCFFPKEMPRFRFGQRRFAKRLRLDWRFSNRDCWYRCLDGTWFEGLITN